MGASVTARNQALDGLNTPVAVLDFLALAVGDPGTTGANENANSGSYARQGVTWNAASGGSKTNSSAESFSTLGTVAVSHFFTASSGTYGAATFGLGGSLTSNVTAANITVAAGALTLGVS